MTGTNLIKAIQSEERIKSYKGFISSLKRQKIAGSILTNYERYLLKEQKKYFELLKCIQKDNPPAG